MRPLLRWSLPWVLLLLLLTLTQPASAATTAASSSKRQCYFPSGALSDHVPCDPNAEVSMCCASADACLSSGLCLMPGTSARRGTSFARGSCTDKAFFGSNCPWWCTVCEFYPVARSPQQS